MGLFLESFSYVHPLEGEGCGAGMHGQGDLGPGQSPLGWLPPYGEVLILVPGIFQDLCEGVYRPLVRPPGTDQSLQASEGHVPSALLHPLPEEATDKRRRPSPVWAG